MRQILEIKNHHVRWLSRGPQQLVKKGHLKHFTKREVRPPPPPDAYFVEYALPPRGPKKVRLAPPPPPPPPPVQPRPLLLRPPLPPPPAPQFVVLQADADGFVCVKADKLWALVKREADSIPRQWWRETLELTVDASLGRGDALPRITGHIAHSQCRVLGCHGRASLRSLISQMHELVIINHCSPVWSCACHPVVRLVRPQASNARASAVRTAP